MDLHYHLYLLHRLKIYLLKHYFLIYSNEVNEIVINRIFSTCGIILKIPIQRFNQNQIDLKLDGPVTVKNILETLYHFYNVAEVNMDILKK